MEIFRKKIVQTKSGSLETPFFMPDATTGFAKSLDREDLEKIGAGPLVVNTYHLYLRPGIELIKKAGGINKFMNWPYPLLSDSGGYQIFSLIHKNPEMGRIMNDKVIFKSPLDGKKHTLTPEKVIQIQFDLRVDMMVVLDDCPPNYYPKKEIEKAVERTIRWAKHCMVEYKKQLKIRRLTGESRPLIFAVIQGGPYTDLRKKCAEELIKIESSAKGEPTFGWDGLSFGGRHHDEKGNLMEELLEFTANLIPESYLRFALGVGMPKDIVKCAAMGWDIFDCVIPTREGRHGRLFKFKVPMPTGRQESPKFKILKGDFYETININNEKFKEDFSPLDGNCDCKLCRNYSRAYLNHLFKTGDPLAMRLATIHNLRFYFKLLEILRKKR